MEYDILFSATQSVESDPGCAEGENGGYVEDILRHEGWLALGKRVCGKCAIESFGSGETFVDVSSMFRRLLNDVPEGRRIV